MPIINLKTAKAKIREIVKSGYIGTTSHCKNIRMVERNVTMNDILYLLWWGDLVPGKENGDDVQSIFRVMGTDIEGIPLKATIKFLDEHRILCITVM